MHPFQAALREAMANQPATISTVSRERSKSTLSYAFAEWINLFVISGTWGSSFVFIKLIGPSVPPFALATARGITASGALLAWLGLRYWLSSKPRKKIQVPTWTLLRHMIVLGTTNGWAANVLTALAVRHVDSGVAAMIQATVPLWVIMLAYFLSTEKEVSIRQFLAVGLGFLGILLIAGPLTILNGRGTIVGVGSMLLTAFCYACGTLYGRHVAGTDRSVLACGQQAFGALIAGIASLLTETVTLGDQPATVWFLLVVLGVMCSAVPTVLYLNVLSRTTSVAAALVAYLQPVWAAMLGCAVLGEQLGTQTLLGSGLVFVGLAVGTGRRASRMAT